MHFRANGEWEDARICASYTRGELQCYQCYMELLMLVMLEVLSNRIVTRLRALIVLPTRDLVTQVRETFEAVGKGRGLKVVYILAYRNHYVLIVSARLAPRQANIHLLMNKRSWFPRLILDRFSLPSRRR